MKRKTLKYSVSVAVLAAMVQATPTFASPVDSPVTQGQINATQGQINDFETKMQQLDNQISVGMDKSQKLNDDIKAQQGKIEDAKVKIEEAKKALDAHKKVYSERLKGIQSDGQQPIITYAEILLSSDNISEFLTRSTAISQFLQSDTDLLNGLKQKEQALTDAEQQLHNELDKLKSDQDELASEQQKIESAKQEVEKELADSKNTLQQQQSQQQAQIQAQLLAQQQAAQQQAQLLAQQQAAQQQTQQQTQQQAQQPAATNNNSQSTTSTSGNTANLTNSQKASQVIAYAEQFLGVPYVWGGSSPSGYDCSGLMHYDFHSVGVNLPRVSQDQQNVGTRISPSQVQPGDLVFKGEPAYHVGMYIGNGQWIQAPETGDVVKISPYNPSSFSSAARVLR
jgi:cell wall-associated NlpC family hydrolase